MSKESERVRNNKTWATYLTYGLYDHSNETFWKNSISLPAGHYLYLEKGKVKLNKWYDLAEIVSPEWDTRKDSEIEEEYLDLLRNSILLRFRSDVPVGVNLSGGLDSSILAGLVSLTQVHDLKAFTFASHDIYYDEDKWAKEMARHAHLNHDVCHIAPHEIPHLANQIQYFQDEPFGGFPTIAYSKIFAHARANKTIVLLDGQGLDEQWAGYDYYRFLNSTPVSESARGPVQGSKTSPVRPDTLVEEFRSEAESVLLPKPFPDALRNALYKDAFISKIPRALRFNDRISMMHSTELREPFLDHRLFELSYRLDETKKIKGDVHKYLLRKIAKKIVPDTLQFAPKRPVQTPQREWLQNDLKEWVTESVLRAERVFKGEWFREGTLVKEINDFFNASKADNSFFIWQWISIDLLFNEGR